MTKTNLSSTYIKLQQIENGVIFCSKKIIGNLYKPLLAIGNICVYDEMICIDTYYDDDGIEIDINLIYGVPEFDGVNQDCFRFSCFFDIENNKFVIASESNIDFDQYSKRVALLFELNTSELLRDEVKNIKVYIEKIK